VPAPRPRTGARLVGRPRAGTGWRYRGPGVAAVPLHPSRSSNEQRRARHAVARGVAWSRLDKDARTLTTTAALHRATPRRARRAHRTSVATPRYLPPARAQKREGMPFLFRYPYGITAVSRLAAAHTPRLRASRNAREFTLAESLTRFAVPLLLATQDGHMVVTLQARR